MNKKAIFFDVDGTLYEYGKGVPDSAKKAIDAVRQQGHLAMVCTGRSRAVIPQDPILAVGFDGILASCGMYAEFQGKEYYNISLPESVIKETMEVFNRGKLTYILEGNQNLYYSKKQHEESPEDSGMWYIEAIEKEAKVTFIAVEEVGIPKDVSKVSVVVRSKEQMKDLQSLQGHFQILKHSQQPVAELVPHGYSKAEGMQRICKELGIAREDTIAFGDSINDCDMLRYAGVGIAMGNGCERAKEAADYITTHLYEDGIWNGLRMLKIL